MTRLPLAGAVGIALVYVGYLGLTLHLALQSLRYAAGITGVGTLATHAFTFLCMGVVIPAMLLRICQGHTGRKILFTSAYELALGLMAVASFFRLVATQLWPATYTTWIMAAGLGWALCFVVIGARVGPFVFAPRVDGRVHSSGGEVGLASSATEDRR
jgi:uncharacterized protein involved in response to NO